MPIWPILKFLYNSLYIPFPSLNILNRLTLVFKMEMYNTRKWANLLYSNVDVGADLLCTDLHVSNNDTDIFWKHNNFKSIKNWNYKTANIS
jgi:hypothetical protein